MQKSEVQIVATVGPASSSREVFTNMVKEGLSVVRLNFAWGTFDERREQIAMVREVARELDKVIPIMQDIPGPRVQYVEGHGYDQSAPILTAKDEESIAFGAELELEYMVLSFVGSADDVAVCRAILAKVGGTQKIIAKVERQKALDHIDEIIAASDAIMIGRGDLASEVPLEEIPFIEEMIIQKTQAANKPVITATQMMLSMTESPIPTRAEVTDVAYAVLLGSDAVMLSEESATGKYPVETISIMRKSADTALLHRSKNLPLHPLVSTIAKGTPEELLTI